MEIFPLVPMGVLAPRSAHARPSAQPPIDMSGNFLAHMSGVGGAEIFKSFSDQPFFLFFVNLFFLGRGQTNLKTFFDQFSRQIKQF